MDPNPVTDEAGSVETVTIGGITMKGSQVRTILGLRSACFEWETEGNTLIFYVTGYGHGVGLSQYGANEMAKEGYSWQEILEYFSGTLPWTGMNKFSDGRQYPGRQ